MNAHTAIRVADGFVTKYGLLISGTHWTDPRRKQLSIDAAMFEITAHRYIGATGREAHLTLEALQVIADGVGNVDGYSVAEMREHAAELCGLGLWERWADDGDTEGWHIAAPTIRYWSEPADGTRGGDVK